MLAPFGRCEVYSVYPLSVSTVCHHDDREEFSRDYSNQYPRASLRLALHAARYLLFSLISLSSYPPILQMMSSLYRGDASPR